MKKLYAFTVMVIIFTLQCVFANADGIPTIKEQLENLNSCWKDKNFDDQILKERILLNDEVKFIRTHLSLVEQKLRDKNTDNLLREQKVNRLKCLDILHDYWTKEVFPKNLYHNKRTPYFIDNFGTACAVGQLIILTDYEKFAKRISKENNYSYIEELNEKYPELKKWADAYGFTIDELAWIQPGYGICDTACNYYAVISAYNGIPPYTYMWSNGQTTMYVIDCCPATSYTCVIIDALGDTVPSDSCEIYFNSQIITGTNILNIPAAIPVYINLSSTDDDGSCNGTATVNVTSGTAPFSYYWQPGGQTTQTATGLCQGAYHVTVLDMNICMNVDTVIVNSSVGINEIKNYSFNLFPNPVNDKLFIQHNNLLTDHATITIYTALGAIVLTEKIIGQTTVIDIGSLNNGVYFIAIDNGAATTRRKIIKNATQLR